MIYLNLLKFDIKDMKIGRFLAYLWVFQHSKWNPQLIEVIYKGN